MKTKLLIFLSLVIWTISSDSAFCGPSYEEFEQTNIAHEENNKVEGMSYIIGGGLGLVSSFALSLTTSQAVPSIGYQLTQLISGSAISYGASLYFIGDSFTFEATRLKELSGRLIENERYSTEQKKKILNAEVDATLRRFNERDVKSHRIRGYMRLATVGTSLISLLINSGSGTAVLVTKVFVIVMASAGGISDLLYQPALNQFEGVQLETNSVLNQNQVSLSFRW